MRVADIVLKKNLQAQVKDYNQIALAAATAALKFKTQKKVDRAAERLEAGKKAKHWHKLP